jgi:hypothetical protein
MRRKKIRRLVLFVFLFFNLDLLVFIYYFILFWGGKGLPQRLFFGEF